VTPEIQRREYLPRTPASAAIMKRMQEEIAGASSTGPTGPPLAEPEVSV